MATEAQTNANRENAKHSTGPKTEEGKAKSSRNNTKFGLITTDNCVAPEEQEDFEYFYSRLWPTLAPAEFIRNAWRLRRCALADPPRFERRLARSTCVSNTTVRIRSPDYSS